MSTAGTMAFDCADPAALAAFWCQALGYAVARLTGAGASVVREDWHDGVPDHFVMPDPEGNEFCVV